MGDEDRTSSETDPAALVDALAGDDDGDALLQDAPDPTVGRTWSPTARRVVLFLAAARFVVPVLALGYAARVLASFGDLSAREVLVLTLLRPAKETLLFAGGVYRVEGFPSPVLLFLAYLPLMVMAVWVFFLLGRMFGERLTSGEGWLARVAPPTYIAAAQLLLLERGPVLALVGRVVAFPPTILAAAAGTTRVNATRYLLADLVGAVIAFLYTFLLGVALGEAYQNYGTTITVVSFVVLLVGISAGQQWFRKELEKVEAREAATDATA